MTVTRQRDSPCQRIQGQSLIGFSGIFLNASHQYIVFPKAMLVLLCQHIPNRVEVYFLGMCLWQDDIGSLERDSQMTQRHGLIGVSGLLEQPVSIGIAGVESLAVTRFGR